VKSELDPLVRTMSDAGHSRVPVYRDTLDDVLGLVHIKDLVPYVGGKGRFDLGATLREALYVAPSMPVLDLLLEMRQSRVHMALVVDEFGGIDGLITIEDLIQYRKHMETLVVKKAEAALPTEFGTFRVIGFQSLLDDSDYVALVKGEWEKDEPVLVRVHSECLTGDVFGSFRCDCGPQLHAAMMMVEREGKGVILYLPQEGRGIGLLNKLKAYKLQEDGVDTVEANHRLGFKEDLRDYGMGAQMLYMLGVRNMRLMTNNPRKIVGVQGHGLQVVERVPLEIEKNPGNQRYLETKKHRLGHLLNL